MDNTGAPAEDPKDKIRFNILAQVNRVGDALEKVRKGEVGETELIAEYIPAIKSIFETRLVPLAKIYGLNDGFSIDNFLYQLYAIQNNKERTDSAAALLEWYMDFCDYLGRRGVYYRPDPDIPEYMKMVHFS